MAVLDGRRGMLVENRRVSLATQVSKQMLSIYTALGFVTQNGKGRPCGIDDCDL